MVVQETYKTYNVKIISMLFILIILTVSFYIIDSYRVTQGLRPLIRTVENRIVLYKTRNFNELETDNFIFRYEDIDGETLELIQNTAENKYREIADVFQHGFEDKVLMIVYNNMDLMLSTTMLKKGDMPIGVYYGDSVHILNPGIWIEEKDKLEYIFYNEGPVLHELAHLFTDHIGNGNFPMWFTEGVSLYFEYMIDGYEWGKEMDAGIYTIDELNNNFHGLDQYRAYTESFRLVKNMVDSYGVEELIDVITYLGKGHNMNEFIHLFEKV